MTVSGQSYTNVRDFMSYAIASVKSFIVSGDIDGLQAFVNDLNSLSENIDSFIAEIPGYLEKYQQIMEQKRALEEEEARRRAQQAEIDKRLREEFGIGASASGSVAGANDPQDAPGAVNVSADDLIGDLGFDFTTPDDGSADADAAAGDAGQPSEAYPADGGGYAPAQDMGAGYQQDAYAYDQDGQQQVPDDGQGYQAAYAAEDFMDGYGGDGTQGMQYMNQVPDPSFGQNPAVTDEYAGMEAAPMDPSAMSQAPDMYADDDKQVPMGGNQEYDQGSHDGYQQDDGGYGSTYPDDGQDGFDPFSQGSDGGQQQYQDYGSQPDAYPPQQGYDQGGAYQDAGQGYDQGMAGYQDQAYAQQGYGDEGQAPQGYAEEPSEGMSMEDLMAEADQNKPPKKRGRRKRGKGSGLKVTPQQQQPASYTDDAAQMDALLDDDFDM